MRPRSSDDALIHVSGDKDGGRLPAVVTPKAVHSAEPHPALAGTHHHQQQTHLHPPQHHPTLVRPQPTLFSLDQQHALGVFVRPPTAANLHQQQSLLAAAAAGRHPDQSARNWLQHRQPGPPSTVPSKVQLPTHLAGAAHQQQMELLGRVNSQPSSAAIAAAERQAAASREAAVAAVNPSSAVDAEYVKRIQEIKALPHGEEFQNALNKWDWVILDGLRMPAIYRGGEKFVAVHIVQMQLLSKFPPNIPNDMMRRFTMVSHKMSMIECWVFNTVNALLCKFEFGCQLFTMQDEVVKLTDVERFYWSVKALNLNRMIDSYRNEIRSTSSLHLSLTATITQLQQRVEIDYREVQKMLAASGGPIGSPVHMSTTPSQQQQQQAQAQAQQQERHALGGVSQAAMLAHQQRQQQAAAAQQVAAIAHANQLRMHHPASHAAIYQANQQAVLEQRQQQAAAARASSLLHYGQTAGGHGQNGHHYLPPGISSGIPPGQHSAAGLGFSLHHHHQQHGLAPSPGRQPTNGHLPAPASHHYR